MWIIISFIIMFIISAYFLNSENILRKTFKENLSNSLVNDYLTWLTWVWGIWLSSVIIWIPVIWFFISMFFSTILWATFSNWLFNNYVEFSILTMFSIVWIYTIYFFIKTAFVSLKFTKEYITYLELVILYFIVWFILLNKLWVFWSTINFSSLISSIWIFLILIALVVILFIFIYSMKKKIIKTQLWNIYKNWLKNNTISDEDLSKIRKILTSNTINLSEAEELVEKFKYIA